MKPAFIEGGQGAIYVSLYQSTMLRSRGLVICFPPLTEEMNKSRRMLALQSRALAQLGFTVAIPDLYGTGDSQGDFSDARWDIWLHDLANVISYGLAQSSSAQGALVFWGVRAGSLLVKDLLDAYPHIIPQHLLLWQAVPRGDRWLRQFLRLQQFSDVSVEPLTEEQIPEIAGYRLHPLLKERLNAASLMLPVGMPLNVGWFELTVAGADGFASASERLLSDWQQMPDISIHTDLQVGAFFWNTQEIVDVPSLVAASTAWLDHIDYG